MAEERILLDALTNLLRTAADRRALEAQLRQSQKMEAIGHLAGGIAHDFNNLLTVINGYSELLLGQFGPDDAARESVVAIYKAGERAVWLTRQLLAFSRRDVVRPRRIDLNAVLDDLHLLLRRLIGEHIVLTVSLGPGTGLVEIDPGQVQQVLMNLAANARDAMPHGGQLTIETRTTRLTDLDVRTRPALRPGEYVTLTVCDTGTGMDEATLARVFEPFFTTKAEGKGTGLGLAVVHGIVSQNRGHCEVVSKVGVGTKFVIYLPRIDEPQPPEPAAGLCSSMPPGRETILLVEDEDAVRALARHILLSCGYTVLESSDGAEAVRLADTHDGPIHLLASDVVMPHMGGRDLAARMAARNPGLKVLFLSGYANDPAFRKAVSTTAVDFLQKPFAPQELAQRVRRLLDEVVSGA
jgi:nitrogen-specific signal transduction histidine kinase/CheY-like chemotaxis protein